VNQKKAGAAFRVSFPQAALSLHRLYNLNFALIFAPDIEGATQRTNNSLKYVSVSQKIFQPGYQKIFDLP